MSDNEYTLIEDLPGKLPEVPEDSVVSRTLLDTAEMKATLFGFAAGQEMTEHTAAYPAVLQVLNGTGHMELSGDLYQLKPGTWIHMPPKLPHSLRAETHLVFLLQLIK